MCKQVELGCNECDAMRLTLVACVLCGMLGGCCQQIPDSKLRVHAPMVHVSDLNGTYAGRATSGLHTSLWDSLTPGDDPNAAGSQIRLAVLNEKTLRIERLVNGVAVERRDMPFRFVGGYARMSWPVCGVTFYDGMVLTGVGCSQTVLTVTPGGRELAVYFDAHVFGTVYLIPIPVDTFPDWTEFTRVDEGPRGKD